MCGETSLVGLKGSWSPLALTLSQAKLTNGADEKFALTNYSDAPGTSSRLCAFA
jgi:hypothetical protein